MASNHYQFTNKATEDLHELLNYISDVICNPTAAKLIFEHIFKKLDTLCSFLESCPVVDNDFIKTRDVRKAIVDNYLMYYVYDRENKIIIVLRIVYARRDVSEILKNY